MRFSALSSLLLLLASTVSVVSAKRICGTNDPSPQLLSDARSLAQAAAADITISKQADERTLTVDTWFHVVAAGNSVEQGNVPDSAVHKQLEVLNKDFAPTGISFKLMGITRTINENWAMDRSEIEMKKALRKGDYKTLNVYFQKLSGGLLGYCYFPTNPNETDRILDGCAVLDTSVPGGSTPNYNLGRTATHEIGHWFGLFHTFQDGCNGGDLVADTPAQRSETSGCPVGQDSCTGPRYPGLDPIQNFMDYSFDSCMYEFTPGQTTRIFQFWDQYRA